MFTNWEVKEDIEEVNRKIVVVYHAHLLRGMIEQGGKKRMKEKWGTAAKSMSQSRQETMKPNCPNGEVNLDWGRDLSNISNRREELHLVIDVMH